MAIDLTTSWKIIHEQSLYRTNTKLRIYAKVKSQSVANNSTVVATWMGIYISDSITYTTTSCTGHVSGAGDFSYSNKNFPANTETYLSGGEFTASHNADGTGRTYCTWWLSQTYGGSVAYTESTWLNLPTIPRTSNVSVSNSNMTAGSTYTVNTNRKSTAFTHTITYSFGNASGTIGTNVADGVSWTPPTSLLAQIPNSNSGTGTITCVTYNGSTQVGTSTCGFTLNVPSYSPSVTNMAVTEKNGNVSALSTSTTVQSLSNKTVSAKVNTSYSATIAKVIIDGTTYTGAWSSGASVSRSGIANKSNGTYTISITDSRGKTASATVNQTYCSYSVPTVSVSASRNSSTVTTGTVTVTAKYSNIMNNSVTVSIQRGSETAKTSSGGSSGSFTTSQTWTDLNSLSSYSFTIKVTDKFNQSVSTTTNIGMNSIPLWIGKSNILMGKGSKVLDNQSVQKTLVDMFYPVGTYYETSNTAFNPNTVWGGTWVEDSQNRFLVGGGSTYGYGSTGGGLNHCHSTSGHTLTVAEMPNHTHSSDTMYNYTNSGETRHSSNWHTSGNTNMLGNGYTGSSNSHTHGNTGYADMVPYYVSVKRWHRTA